MKYTLLTGVFYWLVTNSASSAADIISEDIFRVFVSNDFINFVFSEMVSLAAFILLAIFILRWLMRNPNTGKGRFVGTPLFVLFITLVSIVVFQYIWRYWVTRLSFEFSDYTDADYEFDRTWLPRMAIISSVLFYLKIVLVSIIVIYGYKKIVGIDDSDME